MSLARTRASYAARAAEYIDRLGAIDTTAKADRDLIDGWARRVSGSILDVGCGPGQWSGRLHTQGHQVTGLDPVPAFVEHARLAHPGVPFRVGRAERLPFPNSGVSGILACLVARRT